MKKRAEKKVSVRGLVTTYYQRVSVPLKEGGVKTKNFLQRTWTKLKSLDYQKPAQFIKRRPFVSFFIVLLLLAVLIILGSTVFKAKPLEKHQGEVIKAVQTFKIGTSPKISVQAQVEKTGVIKIVAQTPGIVSAINTYEGEIVSKGKSLLNLSSNYYGGNAASLSRQIAQSQYMLSKDTLDTQKEVIQKQRQVAERSDANTDEMRDIANRSLEESRSLLDLNESLLSSLNTNLSQYEATNSGGINTSLIFQTNSQKAQLQAAINQIRQGIRNTELQAASDRPPAELSNLQREITLKNLEIQEKSLEVNHQVAKLQLQLSQVNEANMFPTTPFKGVVERVHVRLGESVSPGMTLVTISGISGSIILDARVPSQTAKNISQLEESVVQIGSQTFSVMPAYVSGEATDGQLYSVIYHISDEYRDFFTDNGFVTVSIPVGSPDTNSIVPFIPLDAIFQTQEESTVYLVKEGKAEPRKIELGQVQGSYVAVLEGIGQDDQIILSRNVVEGDKVKISN